jgi:hypothetical protein
MINVKKELFEIYKYNFTVNKKSKLLGFIFATFYFLFTLKSKMQKETSNLRGHVSDDVYPLF